MARRRKGVTMNTSPIPLAEFSREEGLISPRFEHLPLQLPRRCLMAFLGEKRIAAFAEKRGGKVLGTFLSLTKPFSLYEIPGEKEPLLLVQAPAGAPAAVLIEDRLFAYGAEKVLAIGCCGSLTDIPENCFFPIEKALRDEGTSYHYLPPSRFIELDKEPLLHLKDYFRKKNLPFSPAITWTSDGFFRETEEKSGAAARKAAAWWTWKPAPWPPAPDTEERNLRKSCSPPTPSPPSPTTSAAGEKKAGTPPSCWVWKRWRKSRSRALAEGPESGRSR